MGIREFKTFKEALTVPEKVRRLWVPPSLYQMPKLRWLELQQNRLARAPVRLMQMKLRHLLTDFEEVRRLSSRS